MVGPDDSVGRSDHLQRQVHAYYFLHLAVDHRVVDIEDVGIVLLSLIKQVLLVHRVVVEALRSVVLSEDVVGKEDFLLVRIGHHGVGPVAHRSLNKRERVLADAERVARLHVMEVPVLMIQSAQDAFRLLRAIDRRIRNLAHQHGQCTAMVALAVVHHDGIDCMEVDLFLEMGHKLLVIRIPYRVDEDGLLVPDQIGIVACTLVGRKLVAMEGLQFPVNLAYPCHFVGYSLSHNDLLLIRCSFGGQRYN